MNFNTLYNKELEEERNININRNKSENKKIITQALKDFNDCVECKNYNEYEREQEILRIIFNFKNVILTNEMSISD